MKAAQIEKVIFEALDKIQEAWEAQGKSVSKTTLTEGIGQLCSQNVRISDFIRYSLLDISSSVQPFKKNESVIGKTPLLRRLSQGMVQERLFNEIN